MNLLGKLPSKQISQTRPANATAVSVYTIADHYRTEIRKIVVCNTSSLAATFRIFHDEDGSTYDETTALFWNVPIDSGETVTITEEYWIDGRSNGNFAVRSATGNALTFTIYGAEEKV
jgi:hypothetical protein